MRAGSSSISSRGSGSGGGWRESDRVLSFARMYTSFSLCEILRASSNCGGISLLLSMIPLLPPLPLPSITPSIPSFANNLAPWFYRPKPHLSQVLASNNSNRSEPSSSLLPGMGG